MSRRSLRGSLRSGLLATISSQPLRWPRPAEVERAVRDLAQRSAAERADLLRLGLFGSYARGDWGVGSDADLIAIVSNSARPFTERSREFDLGSMPVPADLLVYTVEEWSCLLGSGSAFARRIDGEVRWLFERQTACGA